MNGTMSKEKYNKFMDMIQAVYHVGNCNKLVIPKSTVNKLERSIRSAFDDKFAASCMIETFWNNICV